MEKCGEGVLRSAASNTIMIFSLSCSQTTAGLGIDDPELTAGPVSDDPRGDAP